ncbi:MAG: hypothetical protein JSV17_09620 [Candidatus Aminicenantes bacterium]|nr:MAG: hypothetical protein JSV17_09620 [Candidatus Aminicenantes bacterium]
MKKIKEFVLRHFEISLLILILVGILAIVFLVHYKFSFLNFFFLPVILSGYFLGKKSAVLTAIFCILLMVLYLLFFNLLFGTGPGFSLDSAINLITWGGFLILTGAIIGTASEQRESKIRNLRRSYFGSLEILLKYMEVADDMKPRSLRVAILAGKMAEAAGLEKRESENIKSASLLYETGDLQSSLPFFGEVVDFMAAEAEPAEGHMSDRENVMLKSTVSLLKEVEPILSNFYLHYVQEAYNLDKDLEKIPIGSSIIALADIHDRLTNDVPPLQDSEEYRSMEGIEKLRGRAFPHVAIYALHEATSIPERPVQ